MTDTKVLSAPGVLPGPIGTQKKSVLGPAWFWTPKFTKEGT